MADFTLDVENRTLFGKKVNRLRRSGILPATVYGKGVGPFSVQLGAHEFEQLYKRAGRTSLIEINIPGQKKQSAFVHAIQRHPVRRDVIHVDFRAVDLQTPITVAVPIHFVNEPELAKRGDAIVNHQLTSLEIRTLPTDVPPYVEIDMSHLDSFDKSLHVSDIALPAKVELITTAETIVASLSPVQLVEEEEEAVEAAEEGAEPELVREREEEEEEEE